MTKQELKGALKRLMNAKKARDKADAEYEAIKGQLKGHMNEIGVEMLEVDGWKLAYKLVAACSLDSKALKEALPAVYAKYSRITESRRFTVTAPV